MGRNVPARGRTKRKMTALPMPREGGRLKAAKADGGVVSARGVSNRGFSKGGDANIGRFHSDRNDSDPGKSGLIRIGP